MYITKSPTIIQVSGKKWIGNYDSLVGATMGLQPNKNHGKFRNAKFEDAGSVTKINGWLDLAGD